MSKLLLTYLIFGLLAAAYNAQTDRPEYALMDCIYKSFPDDGAEFKKALNDYEKILIKNNVLSDSSGKSYRAVFERIAKGEEITFVAGESFDKVIRVTEKLDERQMEKCQSFIIRNIVTTNSKVHRLAGLLDSLRNAGDATSQIIAEAVLSILSEEDFELPYFKFRVLAITYWLNSNDGTRQNLPDNNSDNVGFNSGNPVNISLDKDGGIHVNEEQITLEQLKKLIRKYEKKNKSESYIILQTGKETPYRIYIGVLDILKSEIGSLRDEFSLEKYGKSFKDLEEKQAATVEKTYPLNIEIPEPD